MSTINLCDPAPAHKPNPSADEICRDWRPHVCSEDGAPQSTYDALLWELREYGIAQLKKSETRRRLGDLTTAQVRELIAALIRLRPEYPTITDELIATIGGQL